jgi:hypothetical protein
LSARSTIIRSGNCASNGRSFTWLRPHPAANGDPATRPEEREQKLSSGHDERARRSRIA